jgi:CheY-like chemotaxis protein
VNDSAASASPERVQVLIVDDSEDAAASLMMLMELEDISAQSAADAEAALRLVERTVPALVLVDIGLPGMDGYELAQRLRSLPRLRATTLIALTGREEHADGRRTVFDQFWTKPFDPKRLIQEVKLVLTRAETAPSSA